MAFGIGCFRLSRLLWLFCSLVYDISIALLLPIYNSQNKQILLPIYAISLCDMYIASYIEKCYTISVRWRRSPLQNRPNGRKEVRVMPEKKKRQYSAAQNKATQKYIKENLEEIKFRVKKGEKDRYKHAAKKSGLGSMAQFFTTAANEKIERDGLSDKE